MNPIIYGDENVVAELTYGTRSDALIQTLRNNLSIQNPLLNEQGKLYAQRSASVFEQVSGWDVVRAARKAVAGVTSYVQTDSILALADLESIQTANVRMQRWIMADIDVRKFFNDGRVDGFSETYIDIQPGMIGRDHYDYRCATHGIVIAKEKDESIRYEVTQYQMPLASWDEALSTRNRTDISRTWQVTRSLLLEGADDPVSRFGGKI